jgi:hypothetical protein
LVGRNGRVAPLVAAVLELEGSLREDFKLLALTPKAAADLGLFLPPRPTRP